MFFITQYFVRIQNLIRNYFSLFITISLLLCISIQLYTVNHIGLVILALAIAIGIVLIPGRGRVTLWLGLIVLTAIRLSGGSTVQKFDSDGGIDLQVRVISVDRTDWGIRLLGEAANNCRVLVSSQFGQTATLPVNGDLYQVAGNWKVVPQTNNPGEFDYRAYLKLNEISGVIQAQELRKIKNAPKWWIPAAASRLRQKISELHHHALPPPYDDLLGSFIFGDFGIQLPAQISTTFKVLGLTHLLVVSGAQVALIAGFLTLLLGYTIPNRKIVVTVVTAVNVIFYFVTGGGPSILRAVVTYEISMLIALNFRNTHWINKLALTGAILMAIRPQSVFDIGAQLSFAATIALLYLAPWIAEHMPRFVPNWANTTISTTLATFVLTVPISIYNFNQISWISIPANLVIVIGAEWIVVVGFFATILGLIWFPLSKFLFEFCLLGLVVILKIASFFISIQPVPTYIRKPPILLIFAYYFSIISIGINGLNSVRKKLVVIGGTAMIWIVWATSSSFESELPLEMTFLDVGQGDATLIDIGHQQYVMIDFGDRCFSPTNGGPNVYGGRVVTQALKSKGANQIDLAVVTHLHKDHYGGLSYVAEQLRIGVLMVNREPNRRILDHYLGVRQRIIQNELGYRHIQLLGNTELIVMHPVNGLPIDSNENNNSIVMQLHKSKFTALLTGDLEKEREEWMVNTYGKQLQSLVLKVGHHGSLSSTSQPFLDLVDPKIAVISCGKFNRYHHPRAQTLNRLRDKHVQVYRTDESGAITIQTDGSGTSVRTVHK